METPTSPPPRYSTHGQRLSGAEAPQVRKNQERLSEYSDPERSSIAFTKAALVFEHRLEDARRKRVSLQGDIPAIDSPGLPTESLDTQVLAEQARHERHQHRIRIARCIQHLLTSAISIVIAFLQGKVYINYEQTKDVPGAFPTHPNLLPTLMLFATALIALLIDICAMVAYMWPQTRMGWKAYRLVISAYPTITTFKSVAFGFSTIVCRSGFDFGNSSGTNNDLWSWSCSDKAAPMEQVNNAEANCTGSTVAWILALSNLAIEILGVGIDQFVARDARKWSEKHAGAGAGAGAPATGSPDGTPLVGRDGKGRYERLTGGEYEKLEAATDDVNGGLKESLPAMPLQPS